MELQQAGLSLPFSELDRLLCDDCIEDAALRRWSPATSIASCDFCRTASVRCRSVLDLFRYMTECIKTEWADPRDGDGWVSREGGWVGAAITDAWDLYDAVGGPLASHELADLFITAIELEWSEPILTDSGPGCASGTAGTDS